MLSAMRARYVERRKRGPPQIIVEDADTAALDDIERARYGISRNRQARRQGFEHDETESIGAARENEHIGRGIKPRQGRVLPPPEKMRVGKTATQRGERRPLAHDELRARQVEAKKSRQILFLRDASDIEKDRPLELGQLVAHGRIEERGIDAAAA